MPVAAHEQLLESVQFTLNSAILFFNGFVILTRVFRVMDATEFKYFKSDLWLPYFAYFKHNRFCLV